MSASTVEELSKLCERLVQSAKGLVQEASDEQLRLLTISEKSVLAKLFLDIGFEKTDNQLDLVKRACELELRRRAGLSELEIAFDSSDSSDNVNPFSVKAGSKGVDYDKLIKRFGSRELSRDLIDRMEKLTGVPVHPWIRRGIFFSHRDFEKVLDAYERKEKFYLYTGRGPSSSAMHIGHLVPFLMTKWLQDTFGVCLVIQMTDDEKFLWKRDKIPTTSDAYRMTRDNVRDIIAIGFDLDKTFIFSDLDYVGSMWPNICSVSRLISVNSSKAVFGFDDSYNIGQVHFPAIQAAPSFSSSFPDVFGNSDKSDILCLIPCAIDQDPYFRLTREVAPKLGLKKPCLLHSKFFPALQGASEKMSASSESSAVFLTDKSDDIRSKIRKHAFSGGKETKEEHRRLGADLSVDVSVAYLEFFMESDEELDRVKIEYASGRMLTSEVKKVLSEILVGIVGRHQSSRDKVTDEMIDSFMTVRKLKL